MEIRSFDLRSSEAQALIAELNAELSAMYSEEGATHFRLDPSEVQKGNGVFLIALQGSRHLGCGAIRCLDEQTAELKRMYVRPEARNRGVAREILRALEKEARAIGVSRLVLETGVRQLAAMALYRRRATWTSLHLAST
jgi:putative acetyltransferase